MESLRSSHPHPQVLHLILIVYGEVEKGEVSTLGEMSTMDEVNNISENPSLMRISLDKKSQRRAHFNR